MTRQKVKSIHPGKGRNKNNIAKPFRRRKTNCSNQTLHYTAKNQLSKLITDGVDWQRHRRSGSIKSEGLKKSSSDEPSPKIKACCKTHFTRNNVPQKVLPCTNEFR